MAEAQKKRKRRTRTRRIYFGPEGHETSMYWTVRVTDAVAPVTINGTAAAAIRAHRGMTIGCALSVTGVENAAQFGHPVYLIAVTKSTLLAVDQRRQDGSPSHAIVYGHSYNKIVELNDDGKLKNAVKVDPTLMERPFHLKPPRKRPGYRSAPGERDRSNRAPGKPYVPRGALQRAVRAGLVAKSVAQQLTDVANRTSDNQNAGV
jgi:hypothetical protein